MVSETYLSFRPVRSAGTINSSLGVVPSMSPLFEVRLLLIVHGL